jgi:hypothetical protein
MLHWPQNIRWMTALSRVRRLATVALLVIEQIVAGHKPDLTGNQSRFLIRRGLINAEGTLAFSILARWLNEYAL